MSVYILRDPRPDRLWCYTGSSDHLQKRFDAHARMGQHHRFSTPISFFEGRGPWLGELYRERLRFEPILTPDCCSWNEEPAWQALVDMHPLCISTNEKRERRSHGEHLISRLVDTMLTAGQPHPWVWLSAAMVGWVTPGIQKHPIARWTIEDEYDRTYTVDHFAAPATAAPEDAPDDRFARDYLDAASLASGNVNDRWLAGATFRDILPFMDLAPYRPGHRAFLRDFFGSGTMADRVLMRHTCGVSSTGSLEELVLAYKPFALDAERTVDVVLNGPDPGDDVEGWDDLNRLTRGLLARRWKERQATRARMKPAERDRLDKEVVRGEKYLQVEVPIWPTILDEPQGWSCDPHRLTFTWHTPRSPTSSPGVTP